MRTMKRLAGVTLIEILLVLVIISMIILMGVGYVQQRTLNMRIDRTVMQMQQILNASLSYYVANGSWPGSIQCLQGSGATGCTTPYLPSNMVSPFGGAYKLITTGSPALATVFTDVTTEGSQSASSIINIIAGRLPLAYTTITKPGKSTAPPNDGTCPVESPSDHCYVVSSVNIPGQNLNNASAVNYAGIYHSGACVPVPQCPVDAKGNTMTPEIIVAPVSVTGANDAPTGSPCSASDTSGCNLNAYPISSFSAYATQPAEVPMDCGLLGSLPCAKDSSNAQLPPGSYWRVCLSTTTQKGKVSPTTNPWGRLQGTILAITRCGIKNEPEGSDFTVWMPSF